MYFRQISSKRYRVYKDKDDHKFHGTVEKQEYTSIDMHTGTRVAKCIWKAEGAASGWRQASKQTFSTREEAGAFLLKEAATPYNQRGSHWTKKQGESAALKLTQAAAQ